MAVDGSIDQLQITRPHLHPLYRNLEDKHQFLRHLRTACCIIPGPLKDVYNTMAILYYFKNHSVAPSLRILIAVILMV